METTVRMFSDGSKWRLVVLSSDPHTATKRGSYFSDGSGYPCFHEVVVLCEKYRSSIV